MRIKYLNLILIIRNIFNHSDDILGLLTKEVDVIDSVVMIVIGAAVGIIAGYFVRKIYLKQKLDKLKTWPKK